MRLPVPMTVVETPEYLKAARNLFDEDGRDLLVNMLAYQPTAGDLIVGAGGLRKLRWAMPGRGKRGGARVIYFFHSANAPVFLLTAYAKNERADLTQAERNELRRLVKVLVDTYERRDL
jgi:hypothetical protein